MARELHIGVVGLLYVRYVSLVVHHASTIRFEGDKRHPISSTAGIKTLSDCDAQTSSMRELMYDNLFPTSG